MLFRSCAAQCLRAGDVGAVRQRPGRNWSRGWLLPRGTLLARYFSVGLFNKTDPAVQKQLALEAQLKVRRASRDDLAARRKAAGTNAVVHREKARKLAAEGADDAELSAVETAMRRTGSRRYAERCGHPGGGDDRRT